MPLAAFTTTPALPPLLSCLSFLICSSHPRRSLPARSHSSRPATAQVPLLTVVSLTDNISSDRRPSLLVNSLHRHSTVMVRCACTTSTIDRGCTNTPQTCYQCCTTHPTIFTCQHHYRQMGNIDANARLARGLVHPSIAAGAPVPGEPEPAPQGDIALQPIAHDPPAAALNVDPPPAPGPGPAPDAAAALAVAAWRAEVDADRAATAVDRAAAVAESAALRRQLSEQATAMREIMAALGALRAPPSHAALPPPAQPLAPAPAAHRAAVLDRTARAVASVNHYSVLALPDDSSEDDAHEVLPQSHTRASASTAILPAAFVPTPAGTEQSAQQQLAAIVTGLNKQGGKFKFASIAELDESLDDWAADKLKAGWTAAKIESIRAYQRQLVHQFYISERRPLKEVLEYHRKWCKAVDAGTIDMFVRGAELDLKILHDVSNPRQFGGAAAFVPPAPRTRKAKDSASAASAPATRGSPAAGKHPAGSCVNHPNSTTHTTAECLRK